MKKTKILYFEMTRDRLKKQNKKKQQQKRKHANWKTKRSK